MPGTDIIGQLRLEHRTRLDHDNRWALFARRSPSSLNAGSLITVVYRNNMASKHRVQFTGLLLAFRRHCSDPTMIVRSVIDGVAVEQVFCVFSPLIEKIEAVRRTDVRRSKAYWLRDKGASRLVWRKEEKREQKR